jgi:hypothetical protein
MEMAASNGHKLAAGVHNAIAAAVADVMVVTNQCLQQETHWPSQCSAALTPSVLSSANDYGDVLGDPRTRLRLLQHVHNPSVAWPLPSVR